MGFPTFLKEIRFKAAEVASGHEARVLIQLENELADSLGMAALHTPAFGGPVHESAQLFAVLPGELEKLARCEVRTFRTKESLKPPAQVRALPGLKTVAARHNPVIAKGLNHSRHPRRLERFAREKGARGTPNESSARCIVSELYAMGTERCSWTSNHLAPRFSQIPV